MYKNKKYNFLVVALLFLISILAGFSTGMSKVRENQQQPEEEIQMPVIENGTEQPQSQFTAPKEDASAFERLDFAFKVAEEGDGFTSYNNFQLDVLGHTQYIARKQYRAFNYDYTEEWLKMEGLMSSKGKNQFISVFTDGDLMKRKYIRDSAYYNYDNKTFSSDLSKAEIKTMTNQEWILGNLKVNSFFTAVNSTTSSILTYDNKGRGKDYYTIKINLKPELLNPKFLSQFESNGGVNTKIKTVYVTFEIDKKTCYLKSYEALGTFSAEYAGVETSCSIAAKEIYMTMNSSCENFIREAVALNFNYQI